MSGSVSTGVGGGRRGWLVSDYMRSVVSEVKERGKVLWDYREGEFVGSVRCGGVWC